MDNKSHNVDGQVDLAKVLARAAELLGATTDAGLAGLLGVKPQTLSMWRTRGTIPFERFCELAVHKNVSLDWLLLGRGAARAATPLMDVRVYEHIFRALWTGAVEVGEPVSAAYVISNACSIYGAIASIGDTSTQQIEADARTANALAALAFAKASVLRQQAESAPQHADPSEVQRLEQLASAYEVRSRR